MNSLIARIVALYAGAALIGLVLVSVPSSSVFLKQLHGLSDAQYGSLFIAQLIFAVIGALLAGPVVKRVAMKTMYIIALLCLMLSSLSLLYAGLVTDQAIAIICVSLSLGLFGFGFGFGGGPLNGLVCVLFPRKTDSALTSLHMMAGVGLMLGPLLFGWFEARAEWLYAPLLLAAASGALLVLSCYSLERDTPQAESPAAVGLSPARSGYFWLVVVIAFMYALIEGMFANWAPTFMADVKGFSADIGAVALSAFWGGVTLGRLLVSFIVARFKPLSIWLSLPALMMLALMLIPGAASSFYAILYFGLAGLACSAFFPLMVAIGSSPFPQSVSWIASMLTASLMCGVGIGSYVMGHYVDAVGLAAMYYYAIIVPVVIFVLIVLSQFILHNWRKSGTGLAASTID